MQLQSRERVADFVSKPRRHLAERRHPAARRQARFVAAEAQHHRVERFPQRADLVGTRQLEAVLALAGSDAIGKGRKLGERSSDVAHEREQDGAKYRGRREHREPEPPRRAPCRRRGVAERCDGDEGRIARLLARIDRLVNGDALHRRVEPSRLGGRPGPALGQRRRDRVADFARRGHGDLSCVIDQHEIRLLDRCQPPQHLGGIRDSTRRQDGGGIAQLTFQALLQGIRDDADTDRPRRGHRDEQRTEQRENQAQVQGWTIAHAAMLRYRATDRDLRSAMCQHFLQCRCNSYVTPALGPCFY